MNSKRWILVISLAVALAGTAASADWRPVGPPGGNVRALAADPQQPRRVYLGTGDGVLYRSDDGGKRWRRLHPGFPRRGFSLDEIVVGPKGHVFVGYWEVQGQGGGVARSTDGGVTFTELRGLAGQSVRALAMAPSDPRWIAVGTLVGVFLSRDGGATWQRITPENDPNLRTIESLAFDPNDSRVLFAGTRHLGWKTVDAGATWEAVHRGMVDDSHVMTLTVAREDPQVVFATACTGIYRSTDGGTCWFKLEGIPESSRRTRAFVRHDAEPSRLLAGTTEGLWVSENEGDTWWRATPGDVTVNALLTMPDGSVLAGTEESGVLRSDDRGRRWTASNTGFSELFVSKVLFDQASKRLLVAVWGSPRNGGVYTSYYPEGPWLPFGEGLEGRQVLTLAAVNGKVVAGTDAGLYVRSDDSRTWLRLPIHVRGRELRPRVTELLALADEGLLAATSDGAVLTRDGGNSWARPSLGDSGEVCGIAVSPLAPDRVVAMTRTGVFRSTDGGVTWERIAPALEGVVPHALAFVPNAPGVLFSTSTAGLFRSDDEGVTWRRVEGGMPHCDLTGLAIHPDGRTIYASDFTRGGIFRSTDGGETWTRMPTDGLASDRVWTVALDPKAPDRVLVGSSAGGLHLLRTHSSAMP